MTVDINPPIVPVDLDAVRERGIQVAQLLQQVRWPNGPLPAVFGLHLSSDVGWMMQEIEQLRNALACVVSLARREILLDPRAVLSAAGAGPACACPAVDEFDWDCPLCSTGEVTTEEMKVLLKLARPAVGWAQGAWTGIYHDDPKKTHHDGLLANVISALVTGLRPGFGPAALPPTRSAEEG